MTCACLAARKCVLYVFHGNMMSSKMKVENVVTVSVPQQTRPSAQAHTLASGSERALKVLATHPSLKRGGQHARLRPMRDRSSHHGSIIGRGVLRLVTVE
jgi:endonuclease/exonuclease/phosphatase family metal-dependent hydrolase